MSKYIYFDEVTELACPCGCDGQMNHSFMQDTAVPMRMDLGFPFQIPSGGAYRCKEYDGKYGAHQGFALDVICNSKQRFDIIEWIFEYNCYIKLKLIEGTPITRIGINNGSIHFDNLTQDSGKADNNAGLKNAPKIDNTIVV